MTQQHPIVPPPDKIHNWLQLQKIGCNLDQILIGAAQWGADQELEACCALLQQKGVPAWSLLRLHRRPKPPSLKEQSIALIDRIQAAKEAWDISELGTIRRALEQLPDKEPSGNSR